jgi:hypothetical protein
MDKAKRTGNIDSKKEDPNWTVDRINETMKGKAETIHILKNQVIHWLFHCLG